MPHPSTFRSSDDSQMLFSSVARDNRRLLANAVRHPTLEDWPRMWAPSLNASGRKVVSTRQVSACLAKLEWESKTVVDLPALLHPTRARAPVGGVFAFQENGPDVYTLALQQNTGPRVTKHVLGIHPDTEVGLTMDPTQDLLAVVFLAQIGSDSANLALRSLSANQPHPMALFPIITVEDVEGGLVRMRIAEDVVGVSFEKRAGYPGTVRLWNWHTGALLADVPQGNAEQNDFQFLTLRVFVTTCAEDSGWIEIFLVTPAKTPEQRSVDSTRDLSITAL
ncbi:hypothetical protein FB45DRAFT_249709 [Roridomyces roridus]|uniref:Uncharacterized protein n=1 Tax=Roridomyces roridus TaxID=1738132 RepID=A0AAD7B9U9_9AGAR|nr:hypothetical protein FB45DRAFT_249709 [Roridomyces roridus]